MMRTAALFVVFVALLAATALASDAEAAIVRQDVATYAPVDQWRPYYITTRSGRTELERECQAVAIKLVVPSTSRQQVLERCLPVEVGPGLYRIDIADLGWDYESWRDTLARYPYSEKLASDGRVFPRVIRADWLVLQLTDAQESDSYYRLVFGGKAPKTRDQALKILGVNQDDRSQFGLIEGRSGVSVQGVRLIKNLDANRGYAWGTNDYLRLTNEKDPLEQPEGDSPHDGEEWIIGVRKVHRASGTDGALQIYFLANGDGKIVARAPVDLVEDHQRFRGLAEIRNPGACIGCHANGINPFKRNEFKETLAAGVEASSYKYDEADKIESFHFADVAKEVRRNNEDFQAIVKLATECEPSDAVSCLTACLSSHDQPLNLERAAHEVECEPAELKRALSAANAYGVEITARLAGMVHGLTVPREAWQQEYVAVVGLYEQYKGAK